MQSGRAFGIGAKGFNGPTGLAVEPVSGDLYVADTGNHRLLRFRAPFANPTRTDPESVLGQSDFTTFRANAGGAVSSSSLDGPRGLAFDALGNLWVADTGNHRVIRFTAAVLASDVASADLVLGQDDFSTNAANHGHGVNADGFDTPTGLAFDAQNRLFVSDFNNARILVFTGSTGSGSSASTVLGQADFTSRGVPAQASAGTLAGPTGLCVDAAGKLYVSIPHDNRVLVFPADAASGSPATDILGQAGFDGTQANSGAAPYASGSTLSAVNDIKVDSAGNLYVADSSNNRVLRYAARIQVRERCARAARPPVRRCQSDQSEQHRLSLQDRH